MEQAGWETLSSCYLFRSRPLRPRPRLGDPGPGTSAPWAGAAQASPAQVRGLRGRGREIEGLRGARALEGRRALPTPGGQLPGKALGTGDGGRRARRSLRGARGPAGPEARAARARPLSPPGRWLQGGAGSRAGVGLSFPAQPGPLDARARRQPHCHSSRPGGLPRRARLSLRAELAR